jgi:hypothetical protein
MEVSDATYRARFWQRFRTDATPWARDNIVWGLIALIAPSILAYASNRHTQIDLELIRNAIWFYAASLLIYVFVHLWRTAAKLDADRSATERRLLAELAYRDVTIVKLQTKPSRTPAEQHDYDVAVRALKEFGEPAIIALRHLRTHGTLTFGTFAPTLPLGLSLDRTLWAYNACRGDGLVTCQDNYPRQGDRTYHIAPTMGPILAELLYQAEEPQQTEELPGLAYPTAPPPS